MRDQIEGAALLRGGGGDDLECRFRGGGARGAAGVAHDARERVEQGAEAVDGDAFDGAVRTPDSVAVATIAPAAGTLRSQG